MQDNKERTVWDMLGGLPSRLVMGVAPMGCSTDDLRKTKIVNNKIRIMLTKYDTNHFPSVYGDGFLRGEPHGA